jgi:hypothetical protein
MLAAPVKIGFSYTFRKPVLLFDLGGMVYIKFAFVVEGRSVMEMNFWFQFLFFGLFLLVLRREKEINITLGIL